MVLIPKKNQISFFFFSIKAIKNKKQLPNAIIFSLLTVGNKFTLNFLNVYSTPTLKKKKTIIFILNIIFIKRSKRLFFKRLRFQIMKFKPNI